MALSVSMRAASDTAAAARSAFAICAAAALPSAVVAASARSSDEISNLPRPLARSARRARRRHRARAPRPRAREERVQAPTNAVAASSARCSEVARVERGIRVIGGGEGRRKPPAQRALPPPSAAASSAAARGGSSASAGGEFLCGRRWRRPCQRVGVFQHAAVRRSRDRARARRRCPWRHAEAQSRVQDLARRMALRSRPPRSKRSRSSASAPPLAPTAAGTSANEPPPPRRHGRAARRRESTRARLRVAQQASATPREPARRPPSRRRRGWPASAAPSIVERDGRRAASGTGVQCADLSADAVASAASSSARSVVAPAMAISHGPSRAVRSPRW